MKDPSTEYLRFTFFFFFFYVTIQFNHSHLMKKITSCIFVLQSSHLYLYNAFNNTDCIEAVLQYKIGKQCVDSVLNNNTNLLNL